MSSTLGLGLLIVMWLFVLAPLLVRNQRPIRKTTDAFDKTRVVYQGGSDALPAPRRPRLLPKDVRRAPVVADDAELVDPRDVVVDDGARSFAVAEERVVLSVVDGSVEEDSTAATGVDVVSGADLELEADAADTTTSNVDSDSADAAAADAVDADADSDANADADADASDTDTDTAADADADAEAEGEEYGAPELVLTDGFAEEDQDREPAGGQFAYDEGYVGPADVLHPEAEYEPYPYAVDEAAEEDEVVEDLGELELTEEDRAFAASRRSRTAFNPEREAQKWAQLKARRQRTLVGFAITVVLSVIAAFVIGGWVWLAPVVAAGLAVLYMVALRKQVLVERELRAQRIARLRRQRLGVRTGSHAVGGDAAVPPRLRRPGAIVVEVDDDSPDFDELDVVYAADAVDVEYLPAHHEQMRAV